MTTPDFNDLTPPIDLHNRWSRDINGMARAARWGARHGWEQARQLWPEPITDRPPTEEDADSGACVQACIDGHWVASHWRSCEHPWLHTPRWRSRPGSTLREEIRDANVALDWIGSHYIGNDAPEKFRVVRRALRRTLEQAGEGG